MTDLASKDFRQFLKDYQPKPLGQERSYAVFLPLIWQENQWQVLYEVRSQAISQPGEVAFPGGSQEEGETLAQTAVRETMEELNLSQEQISLWGELDFMVAGSRTIHCFLGQLHVREEEICPNQEVSQIFSLPLTWLVDNSPTYFSLEMTVDKSSAFPFERIPHGDKYPFSHHQREIPFYQDQKGQTLWGLTALFTHRFTQVLEDGRFKL